MEENQTPSSVAAPAENVAPNTSPNPVDVKQSVEENSKKKSNTTKIVLIIVAVLLVLFLIGGGVIAYIGYSAYQQLKNENVVEDTIEIYSEGENVDEYNQIIEDGTEIEVSDDGIADLPAAPVGMSWIGCSNMGAYFLKPDGWFKLEEQGSDAEACFITKEYIATEEDQFTTGLSVNMVRDVESKTGVSPEGYVKAYITTMADSFDSSVEQLGDGVHFNGYSTGITTESESGEKINVYYLGMASLETDKIYIMWFEGPASEWESTWDIGKEIMLNLVLDSE